LLSCTAQIAPGKIFKTKCILHKELPSQNALANLVGKASLRRIVNRFASDKNTGQNRLRLPRRTTFNETHSVVTS